MRLKAAEQLQELMDEDIRILMAVEIGMKRFKMVPVNHVKFYARFNQEETQYHLDRAHKIGVLIRSNEKKPSYCLNSEGYDVLALHALFQGGFISSIGPSLGRGKESDVFLALTPDNKEVVVKFHRLGQTSFRNIRNLRSFVQNRKHISWLYVSRLSARREYEGLKKIEFLNLKTPVAIAQNRHAVVMERFFGDEINKFRELNNPKEHFDEIIRQYAIIYSKAKVIHGDLGEFNILISPDDEILIIDWPQWVSSEHPNAKELVMRDISNVCIFFRKRFKFNTSPEEIVSEILKNS